MPHLLCVSATVFAFEGDLRGNMRGADGIVLAENVELPDPAVPNAGRLHARDPRVRGDKEPSGHPQGPEQPRPRVEERGHGHVEQPPRPRDARLAPDNVLDAERAREGDLGGGRVKREGGEAGVDEREEERRGRGREPFEEELERDGAAEGESPEGDGRHRGRPRRRRSGADARRGRARAAGGARGRGEGREDGVLQEVEERSDPGDARRVVEGGEGRWGADGVQGDAGKLRGGGRRMGERGRRGS